MSRTTSAGRKVPRGPRPDKAGPGVGAEAETPGRISSAPEATPGAPPRDAVPDGPSAPASAAISLPSSGLAEDILAREEARAIEPVAAPAVHPVGRPESLSFLMAPAREERKPVEATEHLVTFLLGQEEYGLEVRLVQEIIRLTEITPVPRAPEFVRGVINLRGRIIPVVDLKHRLALGRVDEAARAARIVVAKLRERLVGLLVDGASQVLKVPLSLIEPAPEEVVEVDVDYIRGVAKLESRLVILMDLARALGLDGPAGSDAAA